MLHLAEQLLKTLCRRHQSPQRQISPVGRHRLLTYPWPGNVRELAHELERSLVFEDGDSLNFRHLHSVNDGDASAGTPDGTDWFNARFMIPEQGFSIEDAILRIIQHALKQSGGNLSAAARLLGVPRDYLRYRLEQKGGPEAAVESGPLPP